MELKVYIPETTPAPGGGQLWFVIPKENQAKVDIVMKHVSTENTANAIIAAEILGDNDSKYTSDIALRVGGLRYFMYKSFGEWRVGSGGNYSSCIEKRKADILKFFS